MAKILVVDDSAEFLEMMSLLLRQEGHQAVLSAEGSEGLVKALADPPDLAIIDVMMPDVTGYEICRELRGNPSTASVPVIILSARGQSVDRDAALEAGADDYMAKPVEMPQLAKRIEQLLEKGRAAESMPGGTIVLLSLRGGVGVTTLAVNLAATLVQTEAGEVCLLDLCPSSGHVALQLGLRPDPNWSGLLKAGVCDAEAVEAHLLQHGSGLRVLASPVVPPVGQGMPRVTAQATLGILQRRFGSLVVDAPSVLDETTMAALESATAVALIVTAESPSIQAAVGTLRTLKQWSAKVVVVLNQVVPGRQPAGAIERTLKRSPAASIPFDPAQAQALARGAPLALHTPDSSLAQGVRGLAQALARVSTGLAAPH